MILWRLERPEEAERLCREAIRLQPDYAPAHNNLSLALQSLGRWQEATDALRDALRLQPTEVLIHNNLGLALHEQRQWEEAATEYRTALELRPNYVEAMHNLAVTLHVSGDLDAAVRLYRHALHLEPANPVLHNNLGRALHDAGDSGAAVREFQEAIRLQPGYADALNSLGITLREMGMLEQGLRALREVEEIDPEFRGLHNNLALVLDELGDPDAALEYYREAVRRHPDQAPIVANAIRPLAEICAWDEIEDLAERLRRLTAEDRAAVSSPFVWLTIPSTPAEQLLAAETWVREQYGKIEGVRSQLGFTFTRGNHDRLRIGYLSADLRDHAVGRLLLDLIESHDRDRVSVTGYSTGPEDGSDVRRRFRDAFDAFVDLEVWSGVDAARRIYADGIDILVDLTGHTQGARMEILAMRPAPVQVNFLGYPATSGADFIDFVVTDHFLTPPDQQAFYTERFAYLPDCYQPNGRREASDWHPDRADVGLPETGFVYCCFNNPYKITRATWHSWMNILRQTEGSVVWLQGRSDAVIDTLRREAADLGVDPGRLVFSARKPYADYLALYRLADLFLDCFPYNAGATASDALWMGVPLLTLPGETYATRMAGSLVRAIGAPELIVDSIDSYESEAISLAHDSGRLAAMREKVRAGRDASPVFDIRGYAGHLEDAYAWMWEQWLESGR